MGLSRVWILIGIVLVIMVVESIILEILCDNTAKIAFVILMQVGFGKWYKITGILSLISLSIRETTTESN